MKCLFLYFSRIQTQIIQGAPVMSINNPAAILDFSCCSCVGAVSKEPFANQSKARTKPSKNITISIVQMRRIAFSFFMNQPAIYFPSVLVSSSISIGFATWAFIPQSRHRLISSAKASAVMAMTGTRAASFRFRARICLVAS